MKYLPKWLDSFISQKGIAEIEDSILKAETKTSAEIVTMIVHSSSVDYKDFKFLMALSVVFGILTWNALFVILALAVMVVENRIQKKNCLLRASNEFYKNGILNTANKTGVFIFVSLDEKQTVILADIGISSFIDSSFFTEQVSKINNSIKNNKLQEGISLAIQEIGDVCADIAPRFSYDMDELGNEVIIKE